MSVDGAFAGEIRPAPTWARAMFFSVLLLFPVLDLLIAYLYQHSGLRQVILLRYYRDLACLLLAGLGFLQHALPYRLRLSAGVYLACIAIYMIGSLLFETAPFSVILVSIGTLIIPISLTFAAFFAVRTANDMGRMVKLLAVYGVLSALLGMWELHHTEFWTDVVGLGHYIRDVKGVVTGFHPAVLLPWNFFGFGGERRAAGLLAAPLAQGFFLAVVGMVAFAYLRARSVLLACMVMGICFYGVEMSSTRGALIAAAAAALLYFLYPSGDDKKQFTNRSILAVMLVVSLPVLVHHTLYTVHLSDGSTIGHVRAIEKNITQLGDVALVGGGIGAAGARIAAVGGEIEGGGEGALFSIAYQLGVPVALVFLWFFVVLFQRIYAQRHAAATSGELARALAFLFAGVTVTLVTSEHILTFSGMGAFWFLTGGYLGYSCRQRETAHAA